MWKQDVKRGIAIFLSLILFANMFQGHFRDVEAADEKDMTTVSQNMTEDSKNADTLFQSMGENELAAEAVSGEYANLTECITGISNSVAGTIDIGNKDAKLRLTLNFTLPSEAEKPIASNYLYKLDLNQVFAKDTTDGTVRDIAALLVNNIDASNTDTSTNVTLAGAVGGSYYIQDGVIYFDFTQAIDRLQHSADARDGWFVFDCSLNADAYKNESSTYELLFKHEGSPDNPQITVSDKPVYDMGLTIDKTAGVLDAVNHTVAYTITVGNTGEMPVSGITVEDTLGSYLEFVSGSVSGATVTESGKNLSFALPTIGAGETKTITYTCRITDGGYIQQNNAIGGSSGLDNKISATYTDSASVEHKVDMGDGRTEKSVSVTVKKDMVAKNQTMIDDKTIQWTITVNAGEDAFSLDGLQFSDGMSSLDGVTFIDSSFEFTGDTVSTEMQNGMVQAIKTGGTYTFPSGTGNKSFAITYQTKAEPSVGVAKYTNTAKITDGTYTDQASATSPVIGSSLAEKEAVGFDENTPLQNSDGDLIVQWKTTIHVPDNLASTDILKGTDKIYSWGNQLYFSDSSGSYSDPIVPVVQLNGAELASDRYTVVSNNTPKNSTGEKSFSITFDAAKLIGDGAQGKDITITYYTVGNYADLPVNPYSRINYSNAFELTYNSYTENPTASVSLCKLAITEVGDFLSKDVQSVDNENHIITWKITVDPKGATLHDIELADSFDAGDMRFYGCDYNGVKNLFDETGDYYAVAQDTNTWGTYLFRLEQETFTEGGKEYIRLKMKFDDDHLTPTWSFTSDDFPEIEHTYNIYYMTQLVGDQLQKDGISTHSNTVRYDDTSDPLHPIHLEKTKTAEIQTDILKKEGASTADGIKYTLVVNPDGLDLADSSEYIYVIDELPPSQCMKLGSAVVTDEGGSELVFTADEAQVSETADYYSMSFAADQWKFVVPDKRAINITFIAQVLASSAQGSITYNNTATIPAPYVQSAISKSESVNHKVFSHSAGLQGQFFEVLKVDAADISKKLAGAEFTAKEWSFDGTNWNDTGVTYIGKTDSEGKITNAGFKAQGGSTAVMQFGQIYEISETKAPSGYALTGKKYKFIVMNPQNTDDQNRQIIATLPSDTVAVDIDFSFLFTDQKTSVQQNELTITKKYAAADGSALAAAQQPTQKAAFALYSDSYTWEQCENGTVSADKLCQEGTVNDFSYVYDRATDTITLKNIPQGNYTLYEKTAPDGFTRLTKVYHFSVDDARKITWETDTAGSGMIVSVEIENRKSIENQFAIRKKYLDPNGNEMTSIPDAAVFYVQQTACYDADTASYVPVTGTKQELATTDDRNYMLHDLEPGSYEITEAQSALYQTNTQLPYQLEVSAAGVITVKKDGAQITDADVTTTNVSTDVTVTVRNQLKDNLIKVVKEYYQGDTKLTTAQGKAIAEPTFKLYQKNGADYTELKGRLQFSNTGNTSDKQDWYIAGNLEPGDYKITETVDLTKYEPQPDITFSVTADYRIRMSGESTKKFEQTITVKNRALQDNPCRFYFTKSYLNYDGEAIPAMDAQANVHSEFKLYEADGTTPAKDSMGTLINITYNATMNRFEIYGLTAQADNSDKSYVLKETVCPASHTAIGAVSLKVSFNAENSKAYISDVSCSPAGDITLSATAGEPQSITARLVNRVKDNEIRLTKKYYKADGSTVDSSVTEKAAFALKRYEYNPSIPSSEPEEAHYVTVETKSGDALDIYSFTKLEPGKYMLVETAPDGFEACGSLKFEVDDTYKIQVGAVSAAGWDTTAAGDGTMQVELTAKNIRKSNRFVLDKYYIPDAGNKITSADGAFSALRTGTTFVLKKGTEDITASAGFLYDATEKVWSVSNLEDGTYVVEESAAPAGYEKAGNVRLTVSDGKINATYLGTDTEHFTTISDATYKNNTGKVKISLGNEKTQNQLTVTKLYKEADGSVLPYLGIEKGYAGFKLYLAGTDTEVPGKISDTDKYSGIYVIKGLDPGDYELAEQPLTGFVTVSQKLKFTVASDGKITCTALAEPWSLTDNSNAMDVKVQIVNKKDPNAFKINKNYYDAEGTLITDTAAADATSFTIRGVDGTKDPTATFARSGSVFTILNLPMGSYEVTENVPDGYDTAVGTIRLTVDYENRITATYQDGVSEDFAVLNNSNHTRQVAVSLKNHQLKNVIEIHKKYVSATGTELDVSDYETSELAQFTLQRKVGTVYQDVTAADAQADLSKMKQGIYRFLNIAYGTYRIVEEAPDGFTGERDIVFSVDGDSKITIEEPVTGVTSVSDWSKLVELTNNRGPLNVSIRLTKTFQDADGQTVGGAAAGQLFEAVTFEMRNQENSTVGSVVKESEQMMVSFTGIEEGEYIITETQTAERYLPAEPIRVKVTRKGVSVTYDGNAADFTSVQEAGNAFQVGVSLVNHEKETDSHIIIKKTIQGAVTKEEAEGTLRFVVTETATGKATEYTLQQFDYDEMTGEYTLRLPRKPGGYKIQETIYDISGYVCTGVIYQVDGAAVADGKGSAAEVTVTDGQDTTVSFTDSYKPETGKLIITKTIKGEVTREEAEGALQFKVTENKTGAEKIYTLKDFSYNATTGNYILELTEYAGDYTVEETVYDIAGHAIETILYSVDGAAVQTGNKADVAVRKDGITTVAFEDRYTENPGSLVITKTIKGAVTREEAEGALQFTVTNQDTGLTQKYTLKDFQYNKKTGVWTLTLPVSPGGYTVEETVTDIRGYETTSVKYAVDGGKKKASAKATGITVERDGTTTVAYEDTYDTKKGTILITKKLQGDVAGKTAEDAIRFTVTDQSDGKEKTVRLKDFTYDSDTKQYRLEMDVPEGTYRIAESAYEIAGYDLVGHSVAVGDAKAEESFTTKVTVKAGRTKQITFIDQYGKKSSGSETTTTTTSSTTTDTTIISSLTKTGDEANPLVWLLLLLLGAAGIGTGAVVWRKRRNKR